MALSNIRFSLCFWLPKGREEGYRVLGTHSGEERDEGRCLRWHFSHTLYNSATSSAFPHHPSLFSSQLGTACPCLLSCLNFTLGGGGCRYVDLTMHTSLSACKSVFEWFRGGTGKGRPRVSSPLCSGSVIHPFILCRPSLCSPPYLLWWKQQEEWKKTQDSYFIQADCVCYLGNQVIGYGWRWQEAANSSEKTLQFSNLPPSRCLVLGALIWDPGARSK